MTIVMNDILPHTSAQFRTGVGKLMSVPQTSKNNSQHNPNGRHKSLSPASNCHKCMAKCINTVFLKRQARPKDGLGQKMGQAPCAGLGEPTPWAWKPKGKAGLVRLVQGLGEGSRRQNGIGRWVEWGEGRWGTGRPMGGPVWGGGRYKIRPLDAIWSGAALSSPIWATTQRGIFFPFPGQCGSNSMLWVGYGADVLTCLFEPKVWILLFVGSHSQQINYVLLLHIVHFIMDLLLCFGHLLHQGKGGIYIYVRRGASAPTASGIPGVAVPP